MARVPHEEIAQELAENPAAGTGAPEHEWSAAFRNHPVTRANTGKTLIPLALYLDGIAFGVRDSLLGIFVFNLYTLKRHLCMVVRRPNFCRCGCKGWCTLFPIFSCLHWSFVAMARPVLPTERHNGPWAEDTERSRKSGQDLGFCGLLLQIRGDWSEFSHTFGPCGWSNELYCCIFCHAARANRFDVSGFGHSSSPWVEADHQGFDAACKACEVWRNLSREDHAEVKAALGFDRRKKRGGGKVLIVDIPRLSLRQGGRLEPRKGLQDTWLFANCLMPLAFSVRGSLLAPEP